MRHAIGEVGKPLLISLLVIWAVSLTAYLLLDMQYTDYVERVRPDSGDLTPISIMIVTPGAAILYGVMFSVFLTIHWWLSGLFSRTGMAKMPIANFMLAFAGLFMILELFESAATDFHNYSLFCGTQEPQVVIVVDEVHRCARSLFVRRSIGPVVFFLPLFSIPIRILESPLRNRTS